MLVTQGFFRTFGVDFFETYAPVALMTSFRVTYALSVYLNLLIESVRVSERYFE